MTKNPSKTALFRLGAVVATPGAMEASTVDHMRVCLLRHVRGDWGCVCDDDAAINDDALRSGGRVLSAYPLDSALPCPGYGENCLWIITEADRSVTTLLLPSEY